MFIHGEIIFVLISSQSQVKVMSKEKSAGSDPALVKSSQRFEKYWTIDHIGGSMIWTLVSIEGKLDGREYDKYLADYIFIQQILKKMLGKVLTIVDASISNERQNKSVKDIIRNEFIDEYVHLSEQLQDNVAIKEDANAYTSNMTDEQIAELEKNAADLEEVAGA